VKKDTQCSPRRAGRPSIRYHRNGMHTRIIRPERLRPEELDRYLERGWYRIGQTLMTCRFVLYDGVLRSAVWTRSPLLETRFGRSSRRLLARNDHEFTTRVGALQIDAAHERLYEAYVGWAKGDRPESLRQFLHGEATADVFDTQEIAIYRGDRLVGFSLFDLGRKSLQSLAGIFDPELHRYSLGFYSLLLEIRHAQRLGLDWHYAGYVLPGEPSMDYKLRVKGLEYLDLEADRWRPYAELEATRLPTERLDTALQEAVRHLRARGVEPMMRLYPAFELGAYDPALAYCLGEPMFVECHASRRADDALIVTYDLEKRDYRLMRCLRAIARSHDPIETGREFALLVVYETIAQHHEPGMIAALAGGYS
jgi:leucyl-tRNA---protein transferase